MFCFGTHVTGDDIFESLDAIRVVGEEGRHFAVTDGEENALFVGEGELVEMEVVWKFDFKNSEDGCTGAVDDIVNFEFEIAIRIELYGKRMWPMMERDRNDGAHFGDGGLDAVLAHHGVILVGRDGSLGLFGGFLEAGSDGTFGKACSLSLSLGMVCNSGGIEDIAMGGGPDGLFLGEVIGDGLAAIFGLHLSDPGVVGEIMLTEPIALVWTGGEIGLDSLHHNRAGEKPLLIFDSINIDTRKGMIGSLGHDAMR